MSENAELGAFVKAWVPSLLENDGGNCGDFGQPSLITGTQPISSYCWVKSADGQPTIVVPGCPRIWHRRKYPFTVERDIGRPYGDTNIQQFPKSPLHPLFLSVEVCQPGFDFNDLDLISDRTNLRNLLRWVKDECKSEFRIDAELLGDNNTLVLSPFKAGKKYGEGLNRKALENAHSHLPPGWENTFGHHQTVFYEFCGLRTLVRFPVDLSDPQAQDNPTDAVTLPSSSSLTSLPSEESGHGLRYIRGGKLLLQNSMVGLIVRNTTAGHEVNWSDVWHQLYFSQSHTLIIALHQNGTFKETPRAFLSRTGSLTREVRKSQTDLKNVSEILKQIREILNKTEDKRLAFVFPSDINDSVQIHELEGPTHVLI